MFYKIENVTEKQNPAILRQMDLQDPLSTTEYFSIDDEYRFIRTHSKNPNMLFQYSMSRYDGTKVSDDFIVSLIQSNLVDLKLMQKYEVKIFTSKNNVTHLLCGNKKGS